MVRKKDAKDGEEARKPGTALRDLRRHHLLVTQQELAQAAGVSKRTIKRIEYRNAVRESTQLAVIRGLDRLLSEAHGANIRLAVPDIFDHKDRAVEGVNRDLPDEERARLRTEFVGALLKKRLSNTPPLPLPERLEKQSRTKKEEV